MTENSRSEQDGRSSPFDLLQAAALPYRIRQGQLQFCLVSVRRGASWTMPKGNIEQGESGPECAGREAFEEAGSAFDPEVARKLEAFILSAGGSREPEELYTAFRGRMPGAQALLKGRGLLSAA